MIISFVSIPPPPPHTYPSCYLSFRLTFSGSPGDVTQYLSVCPWLVPLSTPPTFPRATINDRMSFCLPGCLDHTFTIHLAPVRYIRSFLILAGMNTAGMNPGMQLSLQRTHFNSWYHITRRRASKSYSNSTFVFCKNLSHQLPMHSALRCIPCRRTDPSPNPRQHLELPLF